jgi:2-hydroxychromene-2-carboxylate isomerase
LEMRRFIRRHGLTAFRLNPHFPVNTLAAMRVATAAALQGDDVAARCTEALFAAMWEQGAKLDEPAVLAATLGAAGLDAAALMQAAQQEPAKAALLAATQQAHARGAFGAPSFFIGDELWFGKERLAEIEAFAAG